MKVFVGLLMLSGLSYSNVFDNIESGDVVETSRMTTVYASSKKSCKDAEEKLIERVKKFSNNSLGNKGLDLKKVTFRTCVSGNLYQASANVEYTYELGVQADLPITLQNYNRGGI